MTAPSPIDRRMYGDLADDVCLLRSDGRTVAKFKTGYRIDHNPEIFDGDDIHRLAYELCVRRKTAAMCAGWMKPGNSARGGADDGNRIRRSDGDFGIGTDGGRRPATDDRDGISLSHHGRDETTAVRQAGRDRGALGEIRPSAEADEHRERLGGKRAAAGLARGAARNGERDGRPVEPAGRDLRTAARTAVTKPAPETPREIVCAVDAGKPCPNTCAREGRCAWAASGPGSPSAKPIEDAPPASGPRDSEGSADGSVAIERANRPAGPNGGDKAGPTDSARIAALEADLADWKRKVRAAFADVVGHLGLEP